jgi:hypothetical protein
MYSVISFAAVCVEIRVNIDIKEMEMVWTCVKEGKMSSRLGRAGLETLKGAEV